MTNALNIVVLFSLILLLSFAALWAFTQKGESDDLSVSENGAFQDEAFEQAKQDLLNMDTSKIAALPSGLAYTPGEKPASTDEHMKADGPLDADWFDNLQKARADKTPISEILFKSCKHAALNGDVRAQAELSLMLYEGEGTAINPPEAFEWLSKSAQADPFEVNLTYKRGRSLEMPGAYFGLFIMWWVGVGVPADEELSSKYLRLAADSGYAAAQHEVGSNHLFGFYGFERDKKQAETWFLKAIENGSRKSFGPLSRIYKDRGNHKAAFKYLELTIHSDGYSLYYGDLANMYLNGLGTQVDKIQALKWYCVAAVQTEYFDNDLLSLKDTMSQKDISEAASLTENWLLKNELLLPRFTRRHERPTCL